MIEVLVDNEPLVDPDLLADIATFERRLAQWQAGELDDDVFRVCRLNNGIYGQRQGGTNQMLRVKLPYGAISPEQLDMLGHISEEYSRGWGHITTRQNIQFHFVELTRVPDAMRDLARVGITTREACGDTVRNIQGCHLAGACPHEVLDITPWAEAAFRYFVRHPYGQRLPRKFKINFSGCATDCGQAMFNDCGVIAVNHTHDDGTVEAGFRVYIAGGLGANPHPALALEPFTPRDQLLPTLEAILRVFDHYGNRDNKLRARMKWLVDTMGFEELSDRIRKERRFLPAAVHWPGGLPVEVLEHGDEPAGTTAHGDATPVGQGTPVTLVASKPYERWVGANVVRGNAKGTVSAYAWARLGDITADQFRALASVQRELGADVRVTNRQNLVFRGLSDDQLPTLYERLDAISMAEPGAELTRDVVACPGADTCNLAVTQSRGLASAIGERLEEEGLAEVGGVRTNISGCTNSCAVSTTSPTSGSSEPSAGPTVGLRPATRCCSAATSARSRSTSATRPSGCPARNAPEATVRVIRRFVAERQRRRALPGVARTQRRGDAPSLPSSRSSTGSRHPTRTPTSTSTSTRPAPTPPRWGTQSARPDPSPCSPDRAGEALAMRIETAEFTDAELAELSDDFERLPASKIVQWAVDHFAPHLALTASMTDAVLIDIATRVEPGIEVVFIDTGYHFPETLETVDAVRRRYGLNLRMMTVAPHAPELWKADPENCCSAVKVGQLDRALDGKAAWMSGLRRAEADTRVRAPIVARDLRGLVKVNPLATWSDRDVAEYIRDHEVPVNPLLGRGFASIGCMPCTRPVLEGEHPRAGRWSGVGTHGVRSARHVTVGLTARGMIDGSCGSTSTSWSGSSTKGHDRADRTGVGTRSVFGHQMRFDLEAGFPLLTTKRLHLRSIIHELLWLLRGDTNIAYLNEHGVTIWDEWADDQGETSAPSTVASGAAGPHPTAATSTSSPSSSIRSGPRRIRAGSSSAPGTSPTSSRWRCPRATPCSSSTSPTVG